MSAGDDYDGTEDDLMTAGELARDRAGAGLAPDDISAPSPGQAAYEAFYAARDAATNEGYDPADWDKLHMSWWEAAAQAAIAAPRIVKLNRELTEAEVAGLRERLEEVRNERPYVLADNPIVTARNPWTERAAEILAEGHP